MHPNTLNRGGYRGGSKGAMAPPPGQACPIKSNKSAPGGAHFTLKVPQLGHILRTKCPSWGTFYEETGAHIAEKVPQQGQTLRKMCPMSRNSCALFVPHFLLAPPPSKFCIRPCPKRCVGVRYL